MLTSQKGEVSIEFMVFIGIVLLIFVLIVGMIGLRIKNINESMVYSDAQRICNIITSEINTATRIEGYYREFELPERLVNNKEYVVLINTDFRFVEVKWDNYNVISNIVTENVSGSANPGKNKIRNDNGVIIIES